MSQPQKKVKPDYSKPLISFSTTEDKEKKEKELHQ
jgi:hypothetical protein